MAEQPDNLQGRIEQTLLERNTGQEPSGNSNSGGIHNQCDSPSGYTRATFRRIPELSATMCKVRTCGKCALAAWERAGGHERIRVAA